MDKQKRRNGHAFHPIMKKGCVHGKSKRAIRKAAKQTTRRQAHEWSGGGLVYMSNISFTSLQNYIF